MTASGIVDTVYDIFTEKVSYSRFSYVWRFWRNSPMNYWHSWRYIYGKRVILRLFTPILHELLTHLAIYLRKQGHTPVYQTNFAWIIDTFDYIFTEKGSYSGFSHQFEWKITDSTVEPGNCLNFVRVTTLKTLFCHLMRFIHPKYITNAFHTV